VARIVEYFGAEVAPYPGHEEPLAKRLPSVEGDWTKIVEKYGLRELPDRGGVPVLACDVDSCRRVECVTDMSRSREIGFLTNQNTWEAFKALFCRLRAEKIIP
jgi:hypothetical protein